MSNSKSALLPPLAAASTGGPSSSQRVLRQLRQCVPEPVWAVASSAQCYANSVSSALLGSIHAYLLAYPLYRSLFTRIRTLPIVEFYIYMWRVDPTLFANTMFANYGLPMLMEALPWYVSRRQLSKILRESRNSISHRLVANEKFSDSAIASFVGLSIVYALVQTLEQVVRTRVLLANRLLIKRLVLERILYSELGSLQQRYQDVFGSEVRTDQLEAHVFNDINETLNLFNNTLPSMVRGAYTLTVSAAELYQNRDAFDVLSLIRPSIVGLVGESVNWMREKYIVDAQTLAMQRNASAMSRVVSNIVDGLAEVQTNNMQRFQLRMLDSVSLAELSSQQGSHTFLNNMYRQVSNRSIFDFASEVYVVRMIMYRRGISHEMYRKVQNDIDYVTRLFGRLFAMGRDGSRVMETQERVIALLNLPSFIQEDTTAQARRKHHMEENQDRPLLKEASSAAAADVAVAASSSSAIATPVPSSAAPFDFQSLHFKRCLFRYKPALPLALNIHVRQPDEPLPLEEQIDSTGTALPSTAPVDLMREVETVLRNAPPLSPGLLSLAVEGTGVQSPVDSPHGSSSVMDDLMQAHEQSDEDSDERDGERSITMSVQQPPPPIALDPELQDLDALLREGESAGCFRFKAHSLPPLPPSLSDRVSSLSNSLPLTPRSSPPVTPCEAGTILFERGRSYALVGQNRSGKSTLMQILCKLHTPEAADCCIELNGGDFMSMPRMDLREHLTYVAQRPFIFPGTIEDNIRVGNSTASNADVQRAAEMAGIFSMEPPKPLANASAPGSKSLVDRTGSMKIVLKPWEQNRLKTVALAAGKWLHGQWMRLHGFEKDGADDEDESAMSEVKAADVTVSSSASSDAASAEATSTAAVSSSSAPVADVPLHPTLLLETAERGSNLSGGFAQSVALARVFLRTSAQIVILDESMGQMDALKKRELIFPTLFKFIKQHRMTLIIISHDVAQVCKLVDHVYVLASGQVVQSGSHTELMTEPTGVYARLVAAEE